jgi:hypothetical protein
MAASLAAHSLSHFIISLTIILLVWTVARKNLTVTHRTLLSVAADDMKLSLDNTAVVTGVLVCAPIVPLLAVTNALDLSAADGVGRLQLSRLNLFRPALNHPSAVVDDELLAHGGEVANDSIAQGPPPETSGRLQAPRWLGRFCVSVFMLAES